MLNIMGTFALLLLLILIIVWFGTSGREALTAGDYLWPHLTFNRANDIRILLFKASWCQLCTQLSKNEWPRLKKEFPSVKFEEIDCDENRNLCMQYGIGAFPTIIIMKNAIPIPYKGSWRYEEMVVALRDML